MDLRDDNTFAQTCSRSVQLAVSAVSAAVRWGAQAMLSARLQPQARHGIEEGRFIGIWELAAASAAASQLHRTLYGQHAPRNGGWWNAQRETAASSTVGAPSATAASAAVLQALPPELMRRVLLSVDLRFDNTIAQSCSRYVHLAVSAISTAARWGEHAMQSARLQPQARDSIRHGEYFVGHGNGNDWQRDIGEAPAPAASTALHRQLYGPNASFYRLGLTVQGDPRLYSSTAAPAGPPVVDAPPGPPGDDDTGALRDTLGDDTCALRDLSEPSTPHREHEPRPAACAAASMPASACADAAPRGLQPGTPPQLVRQSGSSLADVPTPPSRHVPAAIRLSPRAAGAPAGQALRDSFAITPLEGRELRKGSPQPRTADAARKANSRAVADTLVDNDTESPSARTIRIDCDAWCTTSATSAMPASPKAPKAMTIQASSGS